VSRVSLAALLAAATLAFAGPADARPRDTTSQTIQDRDGDNRLEPAPGEDFVVRSDLGTPSPSRERTRQSRLFFGQLSDMHVVDEESPLRVEFLDRFSGPVASAYRPQEALSTQVMDEMVKQMRNTTSAVDGRKLELVMTTGDNSDNTQRNETRWMIDLLDGKKVINPDSGLQGTCDTNFEGIYDGVRGDDQYYEPDSSDGAPANDTEDGRGYSPFEAENVRDAQRRVSVRDFPDLFERANQPFKSTGLDVPWYGIFGNHDALIQGNQGRNEVFEAIAVGCAKVTAPPASTDTLVEGIEALVAGDPSTTSTVPPDPRREPLKKQEYMEEHFASSGQPAGHGFDPAQVAKGMGYYATHPKPGLRFLVLDSIHEEGGDGGSIDEEQFRWMDEQLTEAEIAREHVMVFAHHSLQTMNQFASPFPIPGDMGGNRGATHFGYGAGRNEPCTTGPTETVLCLFRRHPSVIAFVNGHEHNNRIEPFQRAEGPGTGGFWEINTASHIDWPQQSRTLELFDNRDGTLSIFGTILDHGAAPNPGGPPPSDGQGQAPSSTQRLASISRELAYNDPQGRNGEEDAPGDARGSREDRNVELIVRDPYAAG
jgi:metallophosphoesterase (TIGR03767 family)